MTTPQKAEEASELTTIFHAAMTMLGFKTLADAVSLWADVSTDPAQVNASSGRWITYALSLTGARRRQARDLTLAYYRLHRALHTGFTIHNPLATEAVQVSVPLETLRDDFYDTVEALTPEIYDDTPVEIPGAHDEDTMSFEDVPEAPPSEGGEDVTIDLLERFGISELEEIEDRAEEEARIVLEALGPDNLNQKFSTLDTSAPAKDADKARSDLHRSVGFRQAAAMERVVLNGSRDVTHELVRKDHRVVAYARLSRTGTPCGFCAMLISRGAVYKTEESASLGADGDEYHDNCHCTAVPIYSTEHYERDPRFVLNHEYDQLWREFTADYDGDDVLSGWRSFIRARNHSG